jgi:hypothetical protein
MYSSFSATPRLVQMETSDAYDTSAFSRTYPVIRMQTTNIEQLGTLRAFALLRASIWLCEILSVQKAPECLLPKTAVYWKQRK